MSEYSKFPIIHELTNKIPYPIISWNYVITNPPEILHLYWSFFFGILYLLIQILCYIITKICIPHRLINNIDDIQEYLFRIFTKGFTFFFGLYAFYDNNWLYDSNLFYYGFESNIVIKQKLDCCAADIKLLYFCHIGWTLYKLFIEIYQQSTCTAKIDFLATLIHHVSTLILLFGSYYFNIIRIGIIILLLHDPFDIILPICRLYKIFYGINIITNILFGLVVIFFFFSRILIYPYYCILSSINNYVIINNNLYDYIFTIFMVILYILNLYWFCLIINVVIKALSGNLKKIIDPHKQKKQK